MYMTALAAYTELKPVFIECLKEKGNIILATPLNTSSDLVNILPCGTPVVHIIHVWFQPYLDGHIHDYLCPGIPS